MPANKDLPQAVQEVGQAEETADTLVARSAEISQDRTPRRQLFLDLWALVKHNPVNIDLLNKLRTGEDRQFGSDMDVMGKIFEEPVLDSKEKRKETGLMGIRTPLWKPSKDDRTQTLTRMQKQREKDMRKEIKPGGGRLNAEQQRTFEALSARDEVLLAKPDNVDSGRLVIKLFANTGKDISWKGTIEELTMQEMHQSFGRRRTRMSFACIIPGYEYVAYIEQHHPFWALMPTFSFGYWDDATGTVRAITMRQKLVSFGVDFTVFAEGRRVAYIDGKLISVGHNSRITIHDEVLAKDKVFADILLLFTATAGFHKEIRKRIKRRMLGLSGKRTNLYVVDRDELWLMKNPRRLMR
ncbi:MAG: hypothetical protein D6E12_07190 [Desulfovibrio sp.]|nr:MAG: hypothetical protein D6E12_07190 [Desulfovibrio sp.]